MRCRLYPSRERRLKRLFIVGGGISGLAAAWAAERSDPGVEITLAERDARLGGKIRTDRIDGFLLEAGPDSFLSRKPSAIRLSEELGIAGRLMPRSPRSVPAFIMRANALYPLPEGFSGMIPTNLRALTESSLLSEQGRRQVLREPSIPAGPEGDDESVAAFMERRYGEEAFQLLIEPLVSGIYAADAAQLSMDATFPHLRAFERQHGSLTAAFAAAPPAPGGSRHSSPFLSYKGGMDEMVRALSERLDRVRILRGSSVASVSPQGSRYRCVLADGAVREADALILAVPAHETARIVSSFAPALSGLTAGIPFSSCALVHMAYRQEDAGHPLDGYGYLIPAVEGSLLLGCTWTSRKWEGRAPAGTVSMRLHAGRFGRADVHSMPDGELLHMCRRELAATLGIKAEPIMARVQRWERGIPQYTVGHTRRLADIERSLADHPGLFLAGSSYRGIGISDCIDSGERAAAGAQRFLERRVFAPPRRP